VPLFRIVSGAISSELAFYLYRPSKEASLGTAGARFLQALFLT